jgi:thymidylate kinase
MMIAPALKPYALFEGFDGTGKSTTLRRVAELLVDYAPWTAAAPTRHGVGALLRQHLEAPFVNSYAVPFLFIADQIETELQIVKQRDITPVLLDRHVLVSGPSYAPDAWACNQLWAAARMRFSKPSDIFVFTARPETIQGRLENRRETVPSVEYIKDVSSRLTTYAYVLGRTVEIDTDALGEQEAADVVVSLLRPSLEDSW